MSNFSIHLTFSIFLLPGGGLRLQRLHSVPREGMPVNPAASALAGLFSLALTLFCVPPAPLLVSAPPSWLVVSKFHTHCFLFVLVMSRLPSVAFSQTTSVFFSSNASSRSSSVLPECAWASVGLLSGQLTWT